VTYDGAALSSPQEQGAADAVSTQLHASPTPAPPTSIPTHLVIVGPVPHASASGLSGLPTCDHPDYHDAAPVEIAHDKPWPPYQDTRDLTGAIARQRMNIVYSPLPSSTGCGQASPQSLARPLVTPSELTQVTDLLDLLAGVVSTTPVVVSTWPTLFTTPSSEEAVLVVPVVGAVAAPTQRLSHALGDPVAPSRHMPAVSTVPGPQPLPPGQGLSGTTALSIQGDTSKDVMEIHDEHIEF